MSTRHPLEAIWEKDGVGFAGHLPLLSDAPATLARMLADPNWRPNLVAATAILFLPHDGSFARELWSAFDQASWVSPQIAVVLSVHDPDFVVRALDRAWRQCPISPGRWGETLDGKPSPKAVSALVALLDDLRPDDARSLRADLAIAALLHAPREDGQRIALGWRDRLLPQLDAT